MKSVLGYFVRHRTAANLLLAIMLLGGLWAGLNMRTQFLPDIVIERIVVRVAWPGAGPEEIDAQIVARLEPSLLAVEGVASTRASAREGMAWLNLEFEPGWDMSRALDETRAAVDAVSGLPDGAERPTIRQRLFRDRVVDVALWGPVGVDQLTRLALSLQEALFREGVTRTRLISPADPEIRVEIAESEMIRRDLGIADLAATLGGAAFSRPAGDIGEGGARLRSGRDRRDAAALAEVAIGRDADGGRVTLGAVARIETETQGSGRAHFVSGSPAVILRVERDADGDALAIARAVAGAVESMRATLPEAVDLAMTRSRADPIAQRIGLLVRNGLTGLALVLVFLFLFLSARTAFWVALGIPAAMAASLAVIYFAGVSLNMISLFALLLCLGMVVDDAIVVGEHADTLHRRGMAPTEAAETAAARMASPVFAASVTTVIAFMALVAIGGRHGAMIYAIPITVAAVLTASLVESFLVLPAHMRHALSARRSDPWYDAPSRWVDKGFRRLRDGAFRPLLGWVLRARYLAVGAAVALLLHAMTLLSTGALPWRFFDAPESGEVSTSFSMLPIATRADTRAMLDEVTRALDVVNARFEAEHGRAPVRFASGVIGGAKARRLDGAEDLDADLRGSVEVELIDADARAYPQGEFLRAWRAEIGSVPKLDMVSARGGRAGVDDAAVGVALTGAAPRALKAAAEALEARLSAYPEVTGVEDDLPYDVDEISLELTPRGEALGFTVDSVGRELRARLEGVEAAEFPSGGRTARVVVRAARDELGADWLWRTRLRAPSGAWIALSEIATFDTAPGFATIRRENGEVAVSVSVEIETEDAARSAALRDAIAREILPEIASRHDLRWRLTGQAEDERTFLRDALLGFLLCIAGIYLTLAWIFASWTRPLVVMLAIPFGLIGALWGHHWMGVPLSMFSVVGLLGMTGIIINDSIVLIRAADQASPRRAMIPAVIEATAGRLRAVFLTTATTVAGLAPMLFETSSQAQFLKPTVITLAFGLGFGMVIVLIVTPAALAIEQDVRRVLASGRRLGRLGLRRRRRSAAASSAAREAQAR